jgi:FHA domain
MNISKKIINSVVTEMVESVQDMGDVVVIPNTYDVYIHTEDFKDVHPFLNILREQIIKQLEEEVSKRKQPSIMERNKLVSILNRLLGFGPLTGGKNYRRVEENWYINFQECDGKIRIGNEVFELLKGEVCTVRSFSSHQAPSLDSRFGTMVTVYQNDDSVKQSLIDLNEISTLKMNQMSMPKAAPYFATLVYKYKGLADTHTFHMVKDEISVGRRTSENKVDLQLLNVSERISPKHLIIRMEQNTGKFFLSNLGSFGTTVNGIKAPGGRSNAEGHSIQEIELPNNSRISLAGGEVVIDFSIAERK